MLRSIKHFAKLCVFRGNPADVDGRTLTLVVLFFILVVLYSGLGLATGWMSSTESYTSGQNIFDEVVRVFGTICKQLVVALFIYVILQVRSAPQNFRQTFSSYLGVSIIIALLSLVLIVATVLMSSPRLLSALFNVPVRHLPVTGSILTVVSLVYLVSTVWKILAFGYILYKSMEVKFWQGGVVAIMLIYAPEALEIFLEMFRYVVGSIWYAFTVGFF